MRFQSTLPRGERRNSTVSRGRWTEPPCFNPRSRVGSDQHILPADLLDVVGGFNPRSRVGSDGISLAPYHLRDRCVSIHAPAWGATSTFFEICCNHPRDVSIHAPAWGATSHGTSSR